MAFVAQSDTVRNVGKLAEQFGPVMLVCFNDNGERRKVMSLNPEIYGLRSVVSPSALTASVIIPMQDGGSPRSILRSFAQRFRQWRNAALPVPMFGLSFHALASRWPLLLNGGTVGDGPVPEINELWYPARNMPMGYFDRGSAATLANVFPLVLFNEFLFLLAFCMVSSINSDQLIAFRETTFTVTLRGTKHGANHRYFNGSLQVEKAGELLETAPSRVGGNQQPSMVKRIAVAMKVQRLRLEQRSNKSLLAPAPTALGMI